MQLRDRIEELVGKGLKSLDAAHVAFAEAAHCPVLLSCDDRLIRQSGRIRVSVRVLNPLEYLQELTDGGTTD